MAPLPPHQATLQSAVLRAVNFVEINAALQQCYQRGPVGFVLSAETQAQIDVGFEELRAAVDRG